MNSLTRHRLIPVIVNDDVAAADPLAEALVAGGLPIAEVTLRTPAALESISVMAKHSDLFVGAGTVLNADQAETAVEAGARFIVSPGLSSEVAESCRRLGVPYLPGATTATEIQAALALGISTVKFFPSEASGGAPAIKALSAPFGEVRFIPTGGINGDNVGSYLDLPQVDAVGGSWMIDSAALNEGRFDDLTTHLSHTVNTVMGADR